MPQQEALTVVARIRPGRVQDLKRVLGTIEDHVDSWEIVPFARLANVHFARFVLFDEAADRAGRTIEPQLALMTNVDGPIERHMHDLAATCAAGLDEVFGHCEGYPADRERTPRSRFSFLRAHDVRARAFYVNRQGRTVEQIRREEQLRHAINEYLDSAGLSTQSPEAIRLAVVNFVRGRPDLAWALDPPSRLPLSWRARELVHLIALPLAAIVLSPLLLIALPFAIVMLRARERRDVPDRSTAPVETVARLQADEDYWAQNQVTAAGLFKPGWFRFLLATAILAATDYACRHVYNRGSLSGLSTIHFARWVPLDGRRRMFFSSNYNGSLESYMDDFIDKAAWGLNAIFSNGDGFPRTCFLVCGGITDEKAYKRFLPTRQVQSQVWYSAYPHLTTKNIANNAEIRKGLSGQMDADAAKVWLRRFGVGNQLPESGAVARFLDGIPWDTLCRRCR